MFFDSHLLSFTPDQTVLYTDTAKRLLLACLLGGCVGIEREFRHKDAGLRINLLICLGSSLFTIMSPILAGPTGSNKGQVASNVVQGIGFLGAGLILHTRSRTLGLASASTVWVVASIGIACGAGFYFLAVFGTVILLLALMGVGRFEGRLGWKKLPMLYEVRADVGKALGKNIVGAERAEALAEERENARHRMFSSVLRVLDSAGMRLHILDRDNIAGMERITFSVMATPKVHQHLLHELRSSDQSDQVVVFRDLEDS